jgi:outer membrane autotransporter protein
LGDIQGEADQFETDIKQYQLNLYGSYNIENYFIDTQIGIGTTKYDQKRAYLLNDATAEYNSKSISAGFGMGYIWDATEKLSITPYTRFSYIQSNQDEYVESSNLKVDEVELISKQASLGTEVAYNLLSAGGMKFQPKVFMEYAQEMGDDEIAIESQYMDNMAIGTTGYSPDLGNSIIRTGVGIMMMGANNDYSIGIDYRYETRDRYTSNGLMLNGKLFF